MACATAIWVRSDGVNKRVQASFRRAGGSFSPAVNVSEAGQDAADAATDDSFRYVLMPVRLAG